MKSKLLKFIFHQGAIGLRIGKDFDFLLNFFLLENLKELSPMPRESFFFFTNNDGFDFGIF